ncbi:MAG: nucleoside deaminase [Muribaculaceae bacterium]|nr:nucleoside deaminase [Muribaculaceae bacterium]
MYTFSDEYYMRLALAEARQAYEEGEIPIGAVVVADGKVLGRGHNQTELLSDVTAHAEMLAVSAAAHAVGGKYLSGCTLYVTVEPCPMCAGAIGWSQVSRIVYGASDPKRGYLTILRPGTSPFHPRASVTAGVLEDECRALMQDFFSAKRR